MVGAARHRSRDRRARAAVDLRSGRLLAQWLNVEPADEFVTACHDATGGNPFLITELARELAARGAAPSRDEAATVATAAPDSVARSVVARLDAAGPAAGALARAVAVLGDGVPLNHADELADLDRTAATSAVQRLVDIGILRRSERLRFEHPLVRDAVYESIVPVVRGTMHRRAADILEAPRRRHRASRRASAGQRAGRRCGRSSARCAARRRSPSGAAPARRPRTIWPVRWPSRRRPEDRADVLADLGWCEFQCGRPDAERHLREVIAHGDAAPEPRARAATTS